MADRTGALDLVRGITSPAASQRLAALDALVLAVQALDEHELEAIAGAVLLARLDEMDEQCQQAQLLALIELSDRYPLPWRTLNGDLGLNPADLTGTQLDYFERLTEEGEQDWDADSDLWEHQGQAMTAGELRRALASVPRGLPVLVDVYNGGSALRSLSPVELGLSGTGPRPTAVVMTVTVLTTD